MPAIEIDRPELRWLNVRRPLPLAELAGRLVILDFWTASCVNCLHMLPTLDRLTEAFPDDVVVIGVNSPKYIGEHSFERLAHTLGKLAIRHPVIHDPELALWHAYGVGGWPTLVLIGPDGCVLGSLRGEADGERLLAGVGAMIKNWRDQREAPLPPLPLSAPKDEGGRLRFPGKIRRVVLPEGGHGWVVADTGHHQVVLFADDGREVRRFGSGQAGWIDLDAERSAFHAPQGVVGDDAYLYVADTGNHALRRIDAATGEVMTVAGTGARGGILRQSTSAPETGLASPWDVAVTNGHLIFANAGTHQLGAVDLAGGQLTPLAGDGNEDMLDGPAAKARLAQPTGLALDATGERLFFVDSESSAVRVLSLTGTPSVTTLVGGGLFEFGHVNGALDQARLQHCRDLCVDGGGVLVADTLNDRARFVDLALGRIADLETKGTVNGARAVSEPTGIASAGPDRVLLVESNHHRIVELIPSRQARRVWAA